MKQVGCELGCATCSKVAYAKPATVSASTAQLVEAEIGKHVWSERYDRDLADIFAVQDEITEAVTYSDNKSEPGRRACGKGRNFDFLRATEGRSSGSGAIH